MMRYGKAWHVLAVLFVVALIVGLAGTAATAEPETGSRLENVDIPAVKAEPGRASPWTRA